MNLQDISIEALQAEIQARQKAADAIPEHEPALNLHMYYRDKGKTLRRIDVACGSVKEAQQAVLEQLNKDKEVFFKPILGVISAPTPYIPAEAA